MNTMEYRVFACTKILDIYRLNSTEVDKSYYHTEHLNTFTNPNDAESYAVQEKKIHPKKIFSIIEYCTNSHKGHLYREI